MSVKICFSSDIHGNCTHLRQILATSLTFECDVVILGGDLAPRGSGMGVEGNRLHHFLPYKRGRVDWESDEALAYMNEAYHRQGRWFEEVLVPMLAAHPVPTVCLFGNSDWRGLWPRCQRAAREASDAVGAPGRVRFVAGDGDLFTLKTLARRDDSGGGGGGGGPRPPVAAVDALSCSLVPVCAHKKKDWERCDTRDVNDTMARAPYMDPEGFASVAPAQFEATTPGRAHAAAEAAEAAGKGGAGDAAAWGARGASTWGERRRVGQVEGRRVGHVDGVVRCRLDLTEETARDDSIEAALERLVSRWRQQQQQQQQGRGRRLGKQAPGAGMKRKALHDDENDAAPAEKEKERERDEEEEEGEAPSPPSHSSGSSVPPVWVIHAPPRDTVGDLSNGGDNVGSIAIRRAIERYQPSVTMHGHIHESVRLHGGKFTQLIRSGGGGGEDAGPVHQEGTLVISVGNDFRDSNPHCIIVRTDSPGDAVRVECPPLRDKSKAKRVE